MNKADPNMLQFPQGFLWGTATSAHQVEGNNTNNQWWEWEQLPGKVWHGDRSALACDWWRSAEQDFAAHAADALQYAPAEHRVEPRRARSGTV